MLDLRLGFFADFRDPSLLLSGSADALRNLVRELEKFVASDRDELSIHELAWVSPTHPARLYAVRAAVPKPGAFCWSCSSSEFEVVRGKLATLASSDAGHQYFELLGADSDLVVSVGEYDDEWWHQHG
jgi:hypothetical protein